MKQRDVGMGAGLAALMAVCCGGKLLLLGFGLPALALTSGQIVLIAAALVIAVTLVGLFLWRRRSSSAGTCAPRVEAPLVRLQAEHLGNPPTPPERERIGAGAKDRR